TMRRGGYVFFRSGLLWRGWYCFTRATACLVCVCETSSVARMEPEITEPPEPGVHRRLHSDSERWVIKRKFTRYAILVHVQLLPVSLEAVPVDSLPIFQLKLDQVNVDGMGIFRQVLKVPCLRRADPGYLSDILIKMP